MPFLFPPEVVPDHFRRSAVLIPFWRERDRIRVLLTRRAANMSRGAGQVSFAGGLLEQGEGFEDAALREAFEEVGLEPRRATPLGRLDDAWSGTGSLLVPIVAWLEERPSWRANPDEVGEILEPWVDELLDPTARGVEQVTHGSVTYTNTIVRWDRAEVYGLSADLLMEAIEWGIGERPERGRIRLRELESYVAGGGF